MELIYKTKKVEVLCNDETKANKELGNKVAKKLMMVIQFLEASATLKDISAIPQYNLHALKGNLDGLYSIYLGKTTGYRLIIVPLDEMKQPVKDRSKDFYSNVICIEIEEVSKHYE